MPIVPNNKCDKDAGNYSQGTPNKMWFKNLSNTFNKHKLLRLDSTGETTSENKQLEFMPEIKVISNSSGHQPCFTFTGTDGQIFPPKSLNFMSRINSCHGLLQNISSNLINSDCTTNFSSTNINSKPTTVDMSAPSRTCAPCQWPNVKGKGPNSFVSDYGFGGSYRNKLMKFEYRCHPHLQIHPDSPWLKVNSGYFQSTKGSHSESFNQPFMTQNIKCAFNNNFYNHKTMSKHKNSPEMKLNSEKSSCAVVNSKHDVSDSNKCNSTPKTTSVDGQDTIIPLKTTSVDGQDTIIPLKTTSVDGQDTIIPEFVKQMEPVCELLPVSISEKFSSEIPNPCQISTTYFGEDTSVNQTNNINTNKSTPIMPSSEANSPNSVPPPKNVSDNHCEINPQQKHTIAKFHLSIIAKKNHKQPSNQTMKQEIPTTENTHAKCDDKSAQKNCSICTAYITRVHPVCTDFPKSAGCKHSIILLVRGNAKKIRKRKTNNKEKPCGQSSQPKTFIVGVNSSQGSDKPHLFQFIASDTSDSDDSWDSFDSDDEDAVDGASTDLSKIKMEEFFPENSTLLNPMNFRVHISSLPKTSSAQCPSSTTPNHIETINLSWNVQILLDNNKSTSSSIHKTNKKEVHFAADSELTVVHPIVAWSYAYRTSRRGPWEEYARDRERFRRRIKEVGTVLNRILNESHRSQIYNSVYSGIIS